MPNSEKPNDPFQKNTRTDNTLEGWTDPVTQDRSRYCQRLNKHNCSILGVEAKDIEYDVGLTKNCYITVSMQKLSSIHKYTDCNWTRTHNHLIHKQTLNHLAKPASALASSKPNAPNAPASSKEFFNIQANVECGFTLKHVCDMTRTCSYKHILTIQKISESHKLNDHAHLNKLQLS